MRTLLLALAVGALSACATETAYQPAGPNSDGGYREQQIESNRVRISFSGNSLTDRETVENYLLFRAAELTVDRSVLDRQKVPNEAANFGGFVIEQFGESYGAWLHNASHGRDSRPVVTHSEPVSISRETTFERDLSAVHDKALLGQIMDELCESLARDLARKRYAGKTVGIKLRFEGFVTVTRDQTVKTPISSAADIRHAVGLCLKRVKFDKRLRLMGVRIGNLVHASEVPTTSPTVERAKEPARENLSLF